MAANGTQIVNRDQRLWNDAATHFAYCEGCRSVIWPLRPAGVA